MKQVTNAVKYFVLASRFSHLAALRSTLSKCFFILVLAGTTVVGSSFQKENSIRSSKELPRKSVPFSGKYTFNILTNTGTGTASHIGRFTIAEPNNSVQPNEDGSLSITGTAIITAANGDELFATHSGVVTFNEDGTAQADAEFTITGGTGKFNGATGNFESNGIVNLSLGTGAFSFDGTFDF